MKKKILMILLLLGFSLTSCTDSKDNNNSNNNNEDTVVKEPTKYEIVKEFMDSIEIDSKLYQDIALPRLFEDDLGIVNWETSNPDYMTNQGHVYRSEDEDLKVRLTATAILGATKERRYYDVTLLKTPETEAEKIEEALLDFTLIENNTINKDTMVLPRVTNLHAVSISWSSADENIIDNLGNVYRTDKEQTVDLTGVFELGDEAVIKTFKMTVPSTKEDRPDEINANDPRILEKIYVTSAFELLAAVNKAKAGDAIILKDGTYRNINITLKNSGTEENPIFIFAENKENVSISGASLLAVRGDYVTIANLNFINGSPLLDTGCINLEGEHLRLTNCKIQDFQTPLEDYKWVSLTGKYHEVDHNIFDSKTTGGSLLTIWRNDDRQPQYHHIHHNQFMNFLDNGGANGYETIRIGTSTYSQSDSYVLIEDNYFEECDGEIEIVSIKSGRVIVQNNTFVSCLGHVCSRHGKNSLIQGNVFLTGGEKDAGGIRMYDAGHTVRNNYIEGVNTTSDTRAGIVIHSGINKPGIAATPNLQWSVFNILVENNTLVDGLSNNILFCGKYTYAARDSIIRNNLIVSPECGAIRFDKVPVDIKWEDNHFYAPYYKDDSSKFLSDVLPPVSGVTFNTSTININRNENGLKLHETYGAQNVVGATKEDTGCFN